MNAIRIALDGFFVDTEKLHLHPYIGPAKNSDSLFKIYYIFKQLLIKRQNAERYSEFLDRHLRGNLIIRWRMTFMLIEIAAVSNPLLMQKTKARHGILSHQKIRVWNFINRYGI